ALPRRAPASQLRRRPRPHPASCHRARLAERPRACLVLDRRRGLPCRRRGLVVGVVSCPGAPSGVRISRPPDSPTATDQSVLRLMTAEFAIEGGGTSSSMCDLAVKYRAPTYTGDPRQCAYGSTAAGVSASPAPSPTRKNAAQAKGWAWYAVSPRAL